MTWTRRDFLRLSSLGLLAGVLDRRVLHAHRSPGEFRQLRRGVGTFISRGGTIGWLIDRDGALVVDSQYADTAPVFLAGLGMRGAPPLDALINSHHHGDHTAGNGAFREVVPRIVAHRRVPELQRAAAAASGGEAGQTYADTTFEDEWTVELGGERVRAKHYGPAHTGGDCTILFEHADVVHLGDLVFNRAFPFVDRAGGASVAGWIAVLEAVVVEHSADTLYIFGHGIPEAGVTGTRADLLLQRDLLAALLETAGRAVAEGKSREETTAVDRLPGFPEHRPLVEWLTLAVPLAAAYDELSEGR